MYQSSEENQVLEFNSKIWMDNAQKWHCFCSTIFFSCKMMMTSLLVCATGSPAIIVQLFYSAETVSAYPCHPWLQVIDIWNHGLFRNQKFGFFRVRKMTSVSFWPVMVCGMWWRMKRCVTWRENEYSSGTRKTGWNYPQKGEKGLILPHKLQQSSYQTAHFRKAAKITSPWLLSIWNRSENTRAKHDDFKCTWLFEDCYCTIEA